MVCYYLFCNHCGSSVSVCCLLFGLLFVVWLLFVCWRLIVLVGDRCFCLCVVRCLKFLVVRCVLLLFVVCWLLFVRLVVRCRALRRCSLLFVIFRCVVPLVVVMLRACAFFVNYCLFFVALVVCCCLLSVVR